MPAVAHSPATLPPRTQAAVDAAVREGDAVRFCAAILPSVSRTFSIGIRVLPGELGRTVLAAYLICRIADTVEDAGGVSPEEKGRLFETLLGCLDAPTSATALAQHAAALTGEPAHMELVRHAQLVFELFAGLPERWRRHVRLWVTEMIQGMRKFVLLYPDGIRIQTLDEYREYCYYVAGTVGYLLTDLWYEHAPSMGAERYQVLRARCRAFAEALQTVNILKDVARDVEMENSIYVPEQLLREHGSSHAALLTADFRGRNQSALGKLIQLAWADLDDARTYLLVLPRRAISIRMFCALPLLFAYATLRDVALTSHMLRPGGTVKISRAEVKSILVASPLLIWSNRGVRWLVARVRARPLLLARSSVG